MRRFQTRDIGAKAAERMRRMHTPVCAYRPRAQPSTLTANTAMHTRRRGREITGGSASRQVNRRRTGFSFLCPRDQPTDRSQGLARQFPLFSAACPRITEVSWSRSQEQHQQQRIVPQREVAPASPGGPVLSSS